MDNQQPCVLEIRYWVQRLGKVILTKNFLEDEIPTAPQYILLYATLFFIVSVFFSWLWSKKFKNGPLETIMRKISV